MKLGSSSTRTFSYNPQDPAVMKAHTKTLEGVTAKSGQVSTDKVELRGYKVTTVMGRPISTRRDRNLKLRPNNQGEFIYPGDQSDFTVANTFVAAADTVRTFEEKLAQHTGRKLNWAFRNSKLGVSPTSGHWKNAYYSREHGGLFLFSFDTKNGEKSSSGNSGEIVAHEAGHAILDAVKPGWNRSNNVEIRAFHESFGDMLAILMSLKDEKVISSLVEDTGGDLRDGPKSKKNLVSEMGEELGNQIGIRSAYNDFHYKNPSELPNRGNETQLGREAHDFSRLFSGAFYEILDGISDGYRADGQTPDQALRSAADEGWTLLVGMLDKAPMSGGSFRRLAQSMIAGEKELNGGKRQELLRDVFARREIVRTNDLATAETAENVESIVLGPEFGELSGVQVTEYSENSGAPLLSSSHAIEDNVRMLQQDGDILITRPGQQLEIGDFVKQDGSSYTSYLNWDEQGQASLLPSPYFID